MLRKAIMALAETLNRASALTFKLTSGLVWGRDLLRNIAHRVGSLSCDLSAGSKEEAERTLERLRGLPSFLAGSIEEGSDGRWMIRAYLDPRRGNIPRA